MDSYTESGSQRMMCLPFAEWGTACSVVVEKSITKYSN